MRLRLAKLRRLASGITLVGIVLVSGAASRIDKVTWFDDFLGVNLRPEYSLSLVGKGFARLAEKPAIGGWMELAAPVGESSVARVRLGEEPGSSHFNNLNWSIEKNLFAKIRLQLNSTTGLRATVGFVGENDPDNVFALEYRSVATAHCDKNSWHLTAIDSPDWKNNRAAYESYCPNWTHEADQPFVIEFKLSPGSGSVFINGQHMIDVTEHITKGALAFEFQLWDEENNGVWSDVRMSVDYLLIEQDR